MKMNMNALKALELKLAEYSKENGTIAEHKSSNINGCHSGCTIMCTGTCSGDCSGGCQNGCNGRR